MAKLPVAVKLSLSILLPEVVVIRILTVCTGNICRSPLAEKVLQHRLADLDVSVSSAGTRARAGMPMTLQAVELATARGVPEPDAAHAARLLTPRDVLNADLVIALARDHRRAAVELAPSGLSSTFTAREFERLSTGVSDDDIRRVARGAANSAQNAPCDRVRAVLSLVAGLRGVSMPPLVPEDDDVVDPYGRSRATYSRSAEQLDPALSAVERVLRLTLE